MNNLQYAWQKSFTNTRYRIGLHVLFWIVYFILLQIISFVINSSIGINWHYIGIYILLDLFLGEPMIWIVYYLTLMTVYRNIIYKKKYIIGCLCLLLCIVVYIQFFYFSESWTLDLLKSWQYPIPRYQESLFMYVEKGYLHFMTIPVLILQLSFSYFFYIFFPVCCKFLRDQMRLQKRGAELQQQNVQLEMNFLKAQIHPHFLFNTLNNIYSLIMHKEAGKSAEMVAGLSSLLRYALYEGKAEVISLGKEIAMVKDYIALEKVRSDTSSVEVDFPLDVPAIKIPPFLLLPLVENAFKHGVNAQLQHSIVKITLEINSMLQLRVENNFDPDYRHSGSGGLGLLNLKKRLDYYYPKKYFLEAKETGQIFTAVLKLPLLCP